MIVRKLNSPCDSNPCKNSGVCIAILDGKGKLKNYICQCKSSEYIGPLCEQNNYCFSNPCLNGGSCISVVNGYKCICTNSWNGLNCAYESQPFTKALIITQPAQCSPLEKKLCQNGGSCVKLSYSSYKCICPINYSGKFCEIFDICSLNPCKNNGQCIFNSPSHFTCNCTNQYFGSVCELENPCYSSPCQNGGICRYQLIADMNLEMSIKTNVSYICLCYGNFIGKNCDVCKSGFHGEKCDNIVNHCQPNPCVNGLCQWQLDSYICSCYDGMILGK